MALIFSNQVKHSTCTDEMKKTKRLSLTHTHSQTYPPRQQEKQTSFLTQSAALTLTLDANRCVTQSLRTQSIEHNSSLVSDTEQQ